MSSESLDMEIGIISPPIANEYRSINLPKGLLPLNMAYIFSPQGTVVVTGSQRSIIDHHKHLPPCHAIVHQYCSGRRIGTGSWGLIGNDQIILDGNRYTLMLKRCRTWYGRQPRQYAGMKGKMCGKRIRHFLLACMKGEDPIILASYRRLPNERLTIFDKLDSAPVSALAPAEEYADF